MPSPRQSEILHFIRDCQRVRGVSPSIAEIQEQFGFSSPNTVSGHLDALEKKGAIRREPGACRNIRLAGPHGLPRIIDVPIFGAIPAGAPESSEQTADRSLAVDADALRLPKNSRLFGLDVRGDSMTGAGILDGGVVILEHGPGPANGDIVAALIDGATTLKRYRVRRGRPWLQAENPDYPDLIPAAELIVQGIFRALIRVR
ncbi:MAG: transcriptional repressor LexA [Terrimicrobiaceae bacterium]|nr:transcriptional repressor LexA [Terrimicrobiaceae bacterium]